MRFSKMDVGTADSPTDLKFGLAVLLRKLCPNPPKGYYPFGIPFYDLIFEYR